VKRSSWVVLLLMLAAMVLGGWYFGAQAKANDRELPVYVTGGERMAAGQEIYRRGTDAKPFTYPPFAAAPFVPFAKLPAAWQPPLWFCINFLILVAMLRWLHRQGREAWGGAWPWRPVVFWALAGIFGGRHVVSVFTNQSNDLLVAGLVTMVAVSWCRSRAVADAFAGVFAGLGAALKATPLIFLGLFVLRGRWVAATLVLAAAALATLLPDLVWPRADGQAWWRAWYEVNLAGLRVGGAAEAEGAWNAHSVLNQSLSGALVRWFTPVAVPDGHFVVGEKGSVLVAELTAGQLRVVSLAAQAVVLALIALGVRLAAAAVRAGGALSSAQRALGLGEVGMFACGMVLLSPQSSKAHFCVWLFPAVFVVGFLLRYRRDWLTLLLFVAALVLGLLSKEVLGRRLGNLMLAWGNVAGATLLLLLASLRAIWVVRRASSWPRDQLP
jgi:hypothetical protein